MGGLEGSPSRTLVPSCWYPRDLRAIRRAVAAPHDGRLTEPRAATRTGAASVSAHSHRLGRASVSIPAVGQLPPPPGPRREPSFIRSGTIDPTPTPQPYARKPTHDEDPPGRGRSSSQSITCPAARAG